jgi:hypothetical protein
MSGLPSGLIALTVMLNSAAAHAQPVTFTDFNINQPVFTQVYNDRIGNSRFFNGPNTDRVRISAFVSPSPDSDTAPVANGAGALFQSTNGSLTAVSITHPSNPTGVRNLTFVGLTSGGGGGTNEYSTSYDRANTTVAGLLDSWDATPFSVNVSNSKAPNGLVNFTYTAPDFDKNAMPAFVTDLTLTGGGLNPRLDWKVPPGGVTPTSVTIQVRRIDEESTATGRITKATLVHAKTLAPSATGYTVNETFSFAGRPGFPAGLEVGKRYEISVQLEVSTAGSLKGRSRTFFELKPLASDAGEVRVFLPSVGANGEFKFDFAVTRGEKVAIDPVVAVGYDYAIGDGDPLFKSVTLPSIGDGLFDLYLFDGTSYSFQAVVAAGSEYFFSGPGVAKFRIGGIEASAGLNPSDTTAFITTLTFAGDGRFTGTMKPIEFATNIPEPETYALMVAGLVAIALRRPRFGKRLRVA